MFPPASVITKMERKVTSTCAWNLFWLVSHMRGTVPFQCWLCLFCVSYHPAYEEDDQLLWSPGVIPESKVRGFLLDVLSRTTDEKLGCDKPAVHVRDNEQVSTDFIPSFAVLIFYWLLAVTYISQLWLVQLYFTPHTWRISPHRLWMSLSKATTTLVKHSRDIAATWNPQKVRDQPLCWPWRIISCLKNQL